MEPSWFYEKRGNNINIRNLNESSDGNDSSNDHERDFHLSAEESSRIDESSTVP